MSAIKAVSAGAVAAVAARPWLWAEALRLAPPGWWRRRPFLPLPDPAYLAFRLETMYGSAAAQTAPDELVAYLKWCRRMRHLPR